MPSWSCPSTAPAQDPQTLVDKWAYFFREAKNLEVVPPALAEGAFREALEIARRATFSDAEWEEYERAKMAEQDERGAISLARQEGHREGHKAAEIKARRDTLIRLLGRAGIDLADDDRARLEVAEDVAPPIAEGLEVARDTASQCPLNGRTVSRPSAEVCDGLDNCLNALLTPPRQTGPFGG